jgi:hypothetical protein
MPLRTPEDHAASDPERDYCKHCARADGTLKSYDEALEGMSGFLQKTQGLDPSVAQDTARAMMARMPAWKSNRG